VERTFAILKEKFVWPWENVAISQRVTNPAKDRYPDACFDGFLVRGARKLSCKPIPIQGVSDHFPVVLTVAIDRSDGKRIPKKALDISQNSARQLAQALATESSKDAIWRPPERRFAPNRTSVKAPFSFTCAPARSGSVFGR
jgi:hypothetical protein